MLKNIIDVTKEMQVKLGESGEAVKLYYPKAAIERLLGTGETDIQKLKSIAADFCDYAKSAYGEITFSTDVADRFCFSVGKNAVEKALKEYLKERNSIIPESGHENALFLSMQNKRLSVRAVEKLVKKYASAVTSLKKITPHKLRSTYGTSLYRETGDIYLVADVLGHSDVNTTKKHYAALEDNRRRMAATAVRLREEDN